MKIGVLKNARTKMANELLHVIKPDRIYAPKTLSIAIIYDGNIYKVMNDMEPSGCSRCELSIECFHEETSFSFCLTAIPLNGDFSGDLYKGPLKLIE